MNARGPALYERAKRRIPGGTQLLSKRPELFLPDQWPSYYSKAKGAETWDLDGRKYVDMSVCGIGATVLGFADPDVDAAVTGAIASGTMATLNCPEEVELADLLCELHPWAEMVRFGRCGGEAMAMSIRIARAKTRRDVVAFCGYHGWHDWYLAANLADGDRLDGHLLPGLEPAGVPRALAGTALPFHYNNVDELKAIAASHRGQLAAIVMEPVRDREPAPGFLEAARAIASETGAVLIFDEVTSAWRLNTGGVHLRYGVTPDVAVFAKGLSNGYPMAAIIGSAPVMEAAQTTFMSSTYWTEKIGTVAALATIRKHRLHDVGRHLDMLGRAVQNGWRASAERHGLRLSISGIPPLSHFSFTGYEEGAAMQTLFVQMMLERGFLTRNSFYAMFAHQQHHVDAYLASVDDTFAAIAAAVERRTVASLLGGPVAHSGFRRLT